MPRRFAFALLALFVHPAFAWGSAFVGAMCVNFALTGWCPGAIIAAITSAIICERGGMPGNSSGWEGLSCSPMLWNRSTAISRKSVCGKTQNRSARTASATRSATAPGCMPSAIARFT